MTRVDLADFDNFYNNNLQSYLDTGIVQDKLILVETITDPLIVCYHNDLDYNEKYVNDNHYVTVNLHHSGGCVVSFNGDYMIGYFSENSSDFFEYVLNEFVRRLPELLEGDHKIELNGNDILIDGKKISGAMCTNFYNKINFMGFFISYQSDIDIIKNICTKPMEKEPIGLSEFNVNHNSFEQLLLDIIRNFEVMEENIDA